MFNLSPYLRRRHIMRAQSLEQAIKGCDLYVKRSVVKGPMIRGFVTVMLLSPVIIATDGWFLQADAKSKMETTARDGESEKIRRVLLEQGTEICSGRDFRRLHARTPDPKVNERRSCEYNHAYQTRCHGTCPIW